MDETLESMATDRPGKSLMPGFLYDLIEPLHFATLRRGGIPPTRPCRGPPTERTARARESTLNVGLSAAITIPTIWEAPEG